MARSIVTPGVQNFKVTAEEEQKDAMVLAKMP